MARRQTQLDLNPDDRDEDAERPGPLVKPRQTLVRVHVGDSDLARCDNTRSPVTVDQVRDWCAHPDTQVVIQPVIDRARV